MIGLITRLLGSTLGPWILGAAALMAAAGWATAGVQTLRYQSTRADLEETKAQVALDANQAAEEAVKALQAAHDREMQELQAQIEAHRLAVSEARAENTRLTTQLGEFERDLENLHDDPDTHAYLSLPVPASVVERLQWAQGGHQAPGH